MNGLIEALGADYHPTEWRLFIDSSTRSLKAVLLNNGNRMASVPVAYSGELSESYENLKYLLELLLYKDHKWKICADLKVISILLGLQAGYTKRPCFLCLWDSRADKEHFKKFTWTARSNLKPGDPNVIAEPLVEREKILLPPLHIKLGLMKNFVKGLKKESEIFPFLRRKFPRLSDAKIEAGIFDGPQVRALMNDERFEEVVEESERKAWQSFTSLTRNFLSNHQSPDYETIIFELLSNYQKLGARISIKMHFLASHLDFFPSNCGDMSEEQGERFHQDLKTMEHHYQGRWDVSMLADYCWCLKRDASKRVHRRKSLKKAFLG